MKLTRQFLSIFLFTFSILNFPFSILHSSAAVPLKWTVETSRLQPAVFDVVRGETLALEAAFKSYGTPVETSGMTAFLCWQTNGMENAWWVTNAVTTATVARVLFTPGMDPGAKTVTAFLGLSSATNSNNQTIRQSNNYRASFTLRFRSGPGAAPNVIAPPVPILDLSRTVVVNPPWPTKADLAAATNGITFAQLKSKPETVSGYGIADAYTKTQIDGTTVTNGGAKAYADATFRTKADNVCHNDSFSLWTNDRPDMFTNQPYTTTSIMPGYVQWHWKDINGDIWVGVVLSYENSTYEMFFLGTERLNAWRRKVATRNSVFVTYDNVPSTNGFVTASVTNGLVTASVTNLVASEVRTKASAETVSGMQTSISTLNTGYTRLYNFATGATNANFTATNYPPNAAAAASKVHWAPEPGMDFSTVPASLQLNEKRDGSWRTVMDTRDWTVWYFRFKETQLTNEIARLKAENAALSNRLDTAQAWANYTANGVENPMTDTTVVDRPNMWLMADYEWQKCVSGSNQCWVIRAKNVVLSGGSNTNGFLEICDAFGKPYMRVNKSAETFADPVFTDISFDAGEGAWYIVFGNSTKPTKGGANSVIQGNGSGRCVLYDEDDPDCPATITWPVRADSYAGHWIMKAVPKPVGGVVPSQMFFGAEITVAGRDYVEYIKEAAFGAGIRVGNNVYEAVESGNTLIWQKKVN